MPVNCIVKQRTRLKNVLNNTGTNFKLMKEELIRFDCEVLTMNKNEEECCSILQEKIATATELYNSANRIRPINNFPWCLQKNIRHISV
ncbi:hypothetical protein FHG87_010559 [Trinorchestia longiramus]|nr:hypothetical protein FHG87_010559 [Trinorchestia longiramus]